MIFAAEPGSSGMTTSFRARFATRVSVLLADDYAPYRRGLERAVAQHPELTLAATCADGIEAVAALYALRPDCALLDARMPGMGGPDIVRMVGRVLPTTCVLMSSDDAVYDDAVAVGAALGVDKALSRRMLLDLMLAAHRAARTGGAGGGPSFAAAG